MDDYQIHLLEEFNAERMTRDELVRRATVAGISLSALGVLADRAPAAPSLKRGGTARAGVLVPAADVDPVTMFSPGAIQTAQICAEYLVFPDNNYNLRPGLATKWAPGATPKTWTVTIRKGVHWHNGKPLTTDDVVATFNRLTDPASNSAALSAFKGVLSKGNIEKVGTDRVRFHLDRAFTDFPYLLSPFNYNAVILPSDYQVGDFTKGGVGTGAFILKQYTTKVGAKYVRNPNYWLKGQPYMDGVDLKYYADDAALVLALQGNAIDIFPETPFQGSQALFSNSEIKVLPVRSSEYRTLQMRVDKPPFNDRRVRQALALSLDRPALVRGLFSRRAQVANDHAFAPIFPASSLAVKRVPQRKQNIARARALLAAAGHRNGVTVTLETEQYLEIPQYAVFVKAMAKKAGFNVNLKIENQATYYGTGNNQPWLEVPFGITDWAARGTASQVIGPAYLCGAVWNSAHWCNRRFTQLVRAFDAERDEQRRKKIALQAAQIQHDEVPDIIAYWVQQQSTTRKNVNGLPAINAALHLDLRSTWLS